MPVTVRNKKRNEAEILDQATNQLLKAVKDKALQQGKPLNSAQLHREGYSERFIQRVEEA